MHGRPRSQHPVTTRDHVVDGVRLRVRSWGSEGDGLEPAPAVLLLHGLGTTSQLWRDVAPEMCAGSDDGVHVIAPDLAQLGESERPAGRLGATDHARLLIGLLDVLSVQRVVVVGHGVGGAIAVHLAALDGRRVAGLALLDAPVHADAWPPAVLTPLLVPGLREVAARLLPQVPSVAGRLLAVGIGAGTDAAGTHVEQRYLAALQEPGAAAGLARFAAALDFVGVEAAWNIVRAAPPPALVLWGVDDRLHSVAYGRRVAGELPAAAWVPIAGAGHLLPEERPERVAEELLGFHAEVADAAAPVRAG